ncbi:hypothetical protein C7974DRAFT_276648, partial [Boeremia exigua]|uniref:uncharacterized protein n=1 Tax=Boeremia exigua TaxID=749465 RepID=UPI001E8E2510
LFNNPILSDVKMKQISKDGQVRDYYAHKAVLSAGSQYFFNAFTGSFREVSESVMEFHYDDPDHFEFCLKFIYTQDYDEDAIASMGEGASSVLERVLFIIGVYAMADKYDVPVLCEHATKDVQRYLIEKPPSQRDWVTIIRKYYDKVATANGPFGNALVSGILKAQSAGGSSEFFSLIENHPAFGVDVALA